METISNLLEWVQNVAFLLVGLWALVRWRQRGTKQSQWLAATFLALATIVAVGLLTPEDGELPAVVGALVIALLISFPYLLLRFLDSFEPVPQRLRQVLGLVTLGAAAWGAAIPDIENASGASVLALTVVVAALWLVTLGVVTVRFWRAGTGQPTLVRRRLRTLAVASAAIGLALLLIAGGDGAQSGSAAVLVQVLAVASSLSFLVGFAPPGPLKSSWRQREEHALHRASVQLMGATEPQEVADLLVPHVRHVVAAQGSALVHAGQVMAFSGIDEEQLEALRSGTAETTTYPLTGGALHVWTNSYTPFFGEEELELLERLAVLTDLALARTTLLASERDARTQLEAANAELEAFVYSASHDLKSPLIAIQSYLDVLSEEVADALTEDTSWYIDRMRSNAEYMEALVGDLLELSRIGRVATAPEVVDLTEVATEVATAVHDRFPGCAVHVADDLPAVWLNPLRVRQLLRNLVENAASHGGDGVSIWVEALPAAEDGSVEVHVRDDGDGIPADYRDRIFGVFERLEAEGSGVRNTGIGLAICRKITETMGGRIWVTDHDGGAEFAVLFPSSTLADHAPTTTHEVPA